MTAVGRSHTGLRVLASLHAYPPHHNAGSEWSIHTQLVELVRRGHEVTVWLSQCPPLSGEYALDGVTVVPFAARPDIGAAIETADVVVSQLVNVRAAGVLALACRRPFVVVCSLAREEIWREAVAARASLMVHPSRAAHDAAVTWLTGRQGGSAGQMVVRPPVFAERYRTVPGEAVTLINMNANKGGELLWRLALSMPDIRFLGVRGAYDDQIEPPVPVANLEIVDSVPGARMAERVYSRTKVLLMPSREEAWGRVGVEAMASGIPVLAHPTPGVREMLGPAGHYADRESPPQWRSALRRLLSRQEYARASALALARSRELDPTEDLRHFCVAVEELASRHSSAQLSGRQVTS